MTRIMQNAAMIIVALVFSALVNYETVAKSPELLGAPLPGWRLARRVDRVVDYRHATGVSAVDRLLHESLEAVEFYRRLVS